MRKVLFKLLHRYRLVGKRALSLSGRILPRPLFRPLRALAEQIAFRARPQYQGDTLPPIFHYWAARHIAPKAQELEITSPEQFYFDGVRKMTDIVSGPIRVLSIGSGSCTMEVALAARLREAGVGAQVTCIDFNASLLRDAQRHAETIGVDDLMQFLELDCNRVESFPASHVIIVNQFFHHVENLEGFCRAMREALLPCGRIFSSDVVGRNGHLLWPDAQEEVLRFWSELPESKRLDRYFGKPQVRYRPVDHSAYSNEGIRAQDVVACLCAEFDFEIFFTFGGSVMPFVERRIGFNFDPDNAEDRSFIDRVQERDAEALAGGRYPATNMIASLRHRSQSGPRHFYPLPPEAHVRISRQQLAKLRASARSRKQQ